MQWHFKAWLKHSKSFWAQDAYINGSCAIYMLMKWKDVMGWICTTILCHCLVGFAICHCFAEESVQIWHARVMPCRVKRPPMPHELVYSHRRETLINLSLKKKKALTQCIIPKSIWWHRNYPRKLKTLMNLFYTNPIKMQSSIRRTSNLPQANVSLFRTPNQGSITATVSH